MSSTFKWGFFVFILPIKPSFENNQNKNPELLRVRDIIN